MSGDQGTEAGLGALQAGAAMYGGPYGMAAAAVIGVAQGFMKKKKANKQADAMKARREEMERRVQENIKKVEKKGMEMEGKAEVGFAKGGVDLGSMGAVNAMDKIQNDVTDETNRMQAEADFTMGQMMREEQGVRDAGAAAPLAGGVQGLASGAKNYHGGMSGHKKGPKGEWTW
jgi:hypothetical protein